MARHFTGASVERINLALGNLGFDFGPGSVATIAKLDSGTSGVILSWGVSGNPRVIFWIGTSLLSLQLTATSVSGPTALTTGKWYLLAATKATGTVAPRFHSYDYAANSWVHENSGSTAANPGTPTTSGRFGVDAGGSTAWDGDIALAGIWDVVLTDAQIESLPFDLPSWYAPGQPRGLWLLDQAAIAQPVNDVSGGGANETSRTGTTVSTASVPLWTPGVDLIYT